MERARLVEVELILFKEAGGKSAEEGFTDKRFVQAC